MSPDEDHRSSSSSGGAEKAESAPTSAELPEGFDPSADTSADPFEDAFALPPPPERVGAYRVGELIGRGAMGAVYRAEQENPRRTVALKLIRPGAATPEILRRFEYEAHVLGLLQHPGIAQIYEAGMADTAAGLQPFFAMEFVDGMPLRRYAEEHELPPERRLELIARVCDAVAHAHQKGVIHRDLKPSNILVDRDGQPRVLDFGVARVADGDQQETMGTSAGQLIGTLPYMSPEQVSGPSADLDTRSDVYALGVILHELLSGQLPVDTRDRPVAVAVRMIQEDDPARLSSVSRSYRGDIETIVGKALAKDRERRYQTVSALAQDIRHYLADEPIAARPPSTWYQVGKFARRNRALMAGLMVAFVALAAGLAGTAYGLIEARRARDLAEAEAATSARVVDLLAELLGGADPYAGQGPEVTVRDLLQRGAQRVESLREEPLVQARLFETMGQAFENLGAYEQAEPLLVRAIELRAAGPGDDQEVEIARTESALSQVYQGLGRFDEGVAIAERALASIEAREDAGAADRFYASSALAQLLITQAEFDRAEEVVERRLAEVQARGGEPGLRADMYALRAMIRGRTQRLEEALADSRRAVDLYGQRDSPNPLVRSTMLSDQAVILAQMGRIDEAAPLLQEALEINEDWLDPDHPIFATSLHNLGSMKLDLGQYDDAREYLRRAVASRETVYGPEHPAVTSSLNNLAKIHLELGEYEQARPLYERSARIREAALGPQHPALGSTYHAMGDMYRLWERYPESARHYERAIAIQQANGTPDLPAALRSLAEVLDAMGRPQPAAEARARADAVEAQAGER